MEEAIAEFLAAVAKGDHRVVNIPRFTFLCGGSHSSDQPNFQVVRPLFHCYLSAPDISLPGIVVLAEDVFEGYRDDASYSDLFDLEKDLALLAAVILVFVESAGSLAELGAFAAIDEIKAKTVAVIERRYLRVDSFVKEGPLNRLGLGEGGRVHSYDWLDGGTPPSVLRERFLDEHCPDIVDTLRHHLDETNSSQRFSPTDGRHVMLLMADLAHLFLVLRKRELEVLLRGFGVSLPAKGIGGYLFILEKLKLIQRFRYSNEWWFTSGERFLEYQCPATGRSLDWAGMEMSRSKSLRSDPKSRRARAFRYFVRSMEAPA